MYDPKSPTDNPMPELVHQLTIEDDQNRAVAAAGALRMKIQDGLQAMYDRASRDDAIGRGVQVEIDHVQAWLKKQPRGR